MNYARQPLSFIKKLPCRRHDSDTQNNVLQGFQLKNVQIWRNIDRFSQIYIRFLQTGIIFIEFIPKCVNVIIIMLRISDAVFSIHTNSLRALLCTIIVHICDPGSQNQSYVARVYLWQQPTKHCMGQNYRFFFYAKNHQDIN